MTSIQGKTPQSKAEENEKENELKMKRVDAEFEAYRKRIASPMMSSFTQFVKASQNSQYQKMPEFHKRSRSNSRHNS
jgi:hypothetical protein